MNKEYVKGCIDMAIEIIGAPNYNFSFEVIELEKLFKINFYYETNIVKHEEDATNFVEYEDGEWWFKIEKKENIKKILDYVEDFLEILEKANSN